MFRAIALKVKMTQFNIDITSDAICPWCYVGKKKLDKAIKQWKSSDENANDVFVVKWKPFFLKPDAPKKGMPTIQMQDEKFGRDRAEALRQQMKDVGAENGINYNPSSRQGWTGNAHRLIDFAGNRSPQFQDHVVTELFRGYFEDGQDITDLDFLASAGERAGLDRKEVETYLTSDEGLEKVIEEGEKAKLQGISGVPNFVLNNKFEIGGAQDSLTFLDLFQRIKATQKV